MSEEINKNTQTSVKSFLKESVGNGQKTEEVKFSRFPEPFVIKSLSAQEAEVVRKDSTKTHRNKQGQTITELDQAKYGNLLLVRSIVTPDLDNEELQNDYGTLAKPIDTLQAMLMAGELNHISDRVLKLSGLDEEDSLDDIADQAKK